MGLQVERSEMCREVVRDGKDRARGLWTLNQPSLKPTPSLSSVARASPLLFHPN